MFIFDPGVRLEIILLFILLIYFVDFGQCNI